MIGSEGGGGGGSEARCQRIERHAGTAVEAGEIRPLKGKRVGSGGARCGQKADVRKYRLGRAAVLSKKSVERELA